jgi:pilus assembly protein Flp/PilA
MMKVMARFWRQDAGATAIEHALIVALVSIALVVGARSLGQQMGATFNTSKSAMKTA